MSLTRVVAITGCDSGLGWAIAARSAREGLVTVAGMYKGTETDAAESLRRLCAHPYSLDVTNPQSITGFRDYVNCLLKDNPNYRLHAVVNNAGVMIIGNFEWQTTKIVKNMIEVNLLGAMNVVSAFLPDLKKSAENNNSTQKPRVINVASHCGLQPLPGFGAYSASKAGLLAWTRTLRLEHRAHGLSALAFVPGGFIASSNILSNQDKYEEHELKNLSDEQFTLHRENITKLNQYLQGATAQNATFDSMRDENIIETFMQALTEDNPKELYKVESWRYMFYYNLFKLALPEFILDWLIQKFLRFPKLE